MVLGLLSRHPGRGVIGAGSLDAFRGGRPGILIGAGMFAVLYPRRERTMLNRDDFGTLAFPQLAGVNPWLVVIPVCLTLILLLFWMERAGL